MNIKSAICALVLSLAPTHASALPPPTEIKIVAKEDYEKKKQEREKLQKIARELKQENKTLVNLIKTFYVPHWELFVEQGVSKSDDINYSGFGTGFRNQTFSIQLGFDEEGKKERKDNEFEIVGLRVEGRETIHRYKFWLAFGGELFEYQKPYAHIDGLLEVTGGGQFDLKTLKPDRTSESLPTKLELRPLFRAGIKLRATYPFSHITQIPFIQNIGVGVGLSSGYQNIDLIGAQDSNNGYFIRATIHTSFTRQSGYAKLYKNIRDAQDNQKDLPRDYSKYEK